MTTPTDFAAWKAKALELARECERCDCSNEAEWPPNQRYTAAELDAARAALEAHLDDVPMGRPVAHLRRTIGGERWLDIPLPVLEMLPDVDVPLYRHPKDSA